MTVDLGAAEGQALYQDGDSIRQIFEGDEGLYHRFTYSTQRVGENPLDICLPDYDGYQFMGWYDNPRVPRAKRLTQRNCRLPGGIRPYACWAQILPVTFELNYEDPELGEPDLCADNRISGICDV